MITEPKTYFIKLSMGSYYIDYRVSDRTLKTIKLKFYEQCKQFTDLLKELGYKEVKNWQKTYKKLYNYYEKFWWFKIHLRWLY